MLRLIRPRRDWSLMALTALTALGVLVVLAPASTAATAGQAAPTSVVGALLAVACGASINILTWGAVHPGVIAVAVASCAGMVIDALLTKD